MKKLITLLFILLLSAAGLMAQVASITMKTSKPSGSAITLVLAATGTGTVSIDWGDGVKTAETVSTTVNTPTTITKNTIGAQAQITIYISSRVITFLTCASNSLTTLDVTNATGLQYLRCNANSLTSLNVSNQINLKLLYCGQNSLTSLDVTNNTKLEDLAFNSNLISSINLSNQTVMRILTSMYNPLVSLDLSANVALTTLMARNNGLTNLDLSNNPSITTISIYNDRSTDANNFTACALDALYSTLSNRSATTSGTINVLNSAYIPTTGQLDNDGTGSDKTIAIAKNWTVKNYTGSVTLTGDGGGCTKITDYFRSKATGNWENSSNWESSRNNVVWISATKLPTNSAQSIKIQDLHSINIDSDATASNLDINSGGSLTINSGKSLIVNASLFNNGVLTLKSDNTGKVGTFLPPTIINVSGNGIYNVEQYLSGGSNSTTGFPNGRMWYVGCPVKNVRSDVFNAGANANKLWYYVENNHTYTEITNNTTDLTLGVGYVVRMGENITLNFSGTELHSTDKEFNLTYNSGNAKSGFNLIANPYLAFLDWDAITLPTSVMPTIWIRSFNGNSMGFDTYNSESGLSTSNNGNSVTRYIAPMQAFWVEVNANSTITTTNNMRYTKDQIVNTNKLKAPTVSKTVQQVLRLEVSNAENKDETIIAFNNNASDKFDRYDSHKMLNNNVSLPEIYTYAGNDQLAINCMSSLSLDKEYNLGFSTGEVNTFEIKATEINGFEFGTKVILKDKLMNNKETELTVGESYVFASNETTTSDRFSIIFRTSETVTDLNEKNNKNILVYSNFNNQISVVSNNKWNNPSFITIFNAVGQKLATRKLTNPTTVVNEAFNSGVYIVNISNGVESQLYKIIVK